MFIIVGLGNPGEKFKNTRHNVGFEVVNKIADNFQFSIFNFQSKSNAKISQGEIDDEKILLVKPQTFMNDSGKAVKKILAFCHSRESGNPELIVIHDDIDLPIGTIKIVQARGSAGHKGVESIIKELGSSDFIRFRIGIKSNQSCGSDCRTDKARAKDVVLKNFSKDEKVLINETIKKTAEALSYFLENGLEKTMNKYNQ